jgi:hypothetical protein
MRGGAPEAVVRALLTMNVRRGSIHAGFHSTTPLPLLADLRVFRQRATLVRPEIAER